MHFSLQLFDIVLVVALVSFSRLPWQQRERNWLWTRLLGTTLTLSDGSVSSPHSLSCFFQLSLFIHQVQQILIDQIFGNANFTFELLNLHLMLLRSIYIQLPLSHNLWKLGVLRMQSRVYLRAEFFLCCRVGSDTLLWSASSASIVNLEKL